MGYQPFVHARHNFPQGRLPATVEQFREFGPKYMLMALAIYQIPLTFAAITISVGIAKSMKLF